jgi:hypothetical protein
LEDHHKPAGTPDGYSVDTNANVRSNDFDSAKDLSIFKQEI